MTNLKDAEILYLKGFNGTYIKNKSGISIQSLLKRLLSKGIKYNKEDIRNYQVQYIKDNYSLDDVERAYYDIVNGYDNLERAQKGKHIMVLGCGFGEYPKVFREILGKDKYKDLRYHN